MNQAHSKQDRGTGTIAILLPDLRPGGVERVRLLLATEFMQRGHPVHLVLLSARGELLADVPAGCTVVDLQAPRLRSAWRPLHDYLRRERPSALLAAMWPLTAIAGLAVRTSRSRARLVVSEHNDVRQNPAITRFERHLLRRFGPWFYEPAVAVVGVSRGVTESLRECAALPPERMQVIYNPIRALTHAEVAADDHELMSWWNDGESRVISIGTLKPQKDYPTLLRALARLRVDADVRLLVLGEGAERGKLDALIDQLGIRAGVRLAGYRPDPYPYLKLADLFVLSSAWEGLGNVITEALACGTPVVATDCPSGPSEILCDGRFGELVAVGDHIGLAAAMKRTLAKPAETALLARRAGDFSPAAAAHQYLSLLISEPAANARTQV